LILPTRHLTPGQSLIGIAAQLLAQLDRPRTVNQLWELVRASDTVGTFDRFVLALDLLFVMGAVEFAAGRLRIVS
jgi:hypothetical protein